METLNDETYMQLALNLAQQMIGQTSVNPVVGCVVVKDGRVVGLGAHLQRGTAHAEVHALEMAGEAAAGSTVYVTLEPCSHYGKTPPCAQRLIDAHVKKVIVAALDPNPQVAGSGVAMLREAKIEVETGVLATEAGQLNEAFNKYITTRLPFVMIKTASTLDGKIASKTGDSQWITGAKSREYVHVLRHQYDAIMVGIETVLADDPQLTTRLSVAAIHPTRIIVDSKLRLPLEAKVVTDNETPTWVLTTNEAPTDKEQQLAERGVRVIRCGSGQVDFKQALKRLGELEIASLLVEGGGRINGSLLSLGLVDKVALFYAPKIVGGEMAPANFHFTGFSAMSEAIQLKDVTVKQYGDDICLIGYPEQKGE